MIIVIKVIMEYNLVYACVTLTKRSRHSWNHIQEVILLYSTILPGSSQRGQNSNLITEMKFEEVIKKLI